MLTTNKLEYDYFDNALHETKLFIKYKQVLMVYKFCFRFMEHNEKTDLWIDLPASTCKIFWPETVSMEMYVKYKDSKLPSQAFFIATLHHTVLKMEKGVSTHLILRKTHKTHFL